MAAAAAAARPQHPSAKHALVLVLCSFLIGLVAGETFNTYEGRLNVVFTISSLWHALLLMSQSRWNNIVERLCWLLGILGMCVGILEVLRGELPGGQDVEYYFLKLEGAPIMLDVSLLGSSTLSELSTGVYQLLRPVCKFESI